MKNNFDCIFCNNPTSTYYNCRVCNSCKTVSNFSLDKEELYDEVRNCLNSIQKYIESITDILHNIESRHINKKELSFEEQRIYDFCVAFQSCRTELEFMIAHHINSQDKKFRMRLYTLLDLSADFQNIFHHECHILSI